MSDGNSMSVLKIKESIISVLKKHKVAILGSEEPPGVAIWVTEEPCGRGITHPLFLMHRNSLEEKYSEARTA